MIIPTATLLISCPDQKGLVAKIANFIYAKGGNIIHIVANCKKACGF